LEKLFLFYKFFKTLDDYVESYIATVIPIAIGIVVLRPALTDQSLRRSELY